jgi:hypothetical protein
LTKRENEIRRLVVDGRTNDAIASELRISPRTVEAHLRMLFRKTGASRREQLASPSGVPAGQGAAPRRNRASDQEQRDDQYESVMRRLIDRQFSLFEERVDMTLTIGERPGEDMVVERHSTTPTPYLIYRVIRPITPTGIAYSDLASLLSITCDVVDSDINAPVELLADRRGRPMAIVFFQPGLQEKTEWVVRYRTPGMWDPLRETGMDHLLWSTGTLDGRMNASIHDLTVRFEFPGDADGITVTEELGVGQIDLPEPGGTSVIFRDLSQTGARYNWTLGMRWVQAPGPGGSRV